MINFGIELREQFLDATKVCLFFLSSNGATDCESHCVHCYGLANVEDCIMHKVVTLRYVAIGLTITPLSNNVEQNISNFIINMK